MKVRLTYLLFLSLFWAKTSLGQQKDFVGLTGLNITKNINRAWDFSVGTQTMFNQNLSELWIGFADVSIGYRINKNINTELHFRKIAFRNLDNFYENRNLFYHTISLSKSKSKFSFSVRNRLQQLVYGEHFNDRFKGPRWYNRDKFMIHYRINYYLSPFVSTELFFPLNHPTRSGIDQWRAAIGCSININDYFRLDPYYQIQQQMHRQTNYTFYLIGLNATIKFK